MTNYIDTIKTEIEVKPEYLSPATIRDKLLETLRKEKIGKYTARDGLTVDVIRLLDIIDSRISMADSKIWFTVDYEREVFFPTKEKVLTGGRVFKILNEGMFVEMKGFKTFLTDGRKIVTSSTTEYVFDECGCSFAENDYVDVNLLDWNYRNGTLYCVGKHLCAKEKKKN